MEPAERQQQLLEAIIQEYIKTARPVSSLTLVQEYGFDYSTATIRNDMADLEEAGLIAQPHTSAGRIPTEQGYHYYIQHFLHERTLPKAQRSKLKEVAAPATRDPQQLFKNVARVLSEVTGETVFIAFANGNYIMAGLSQIFHKPDFTDVEQILALSDAFDHLEEIVAAMKQHLQSDIQILIGDENPFSPECSTIVASLTSPYHRDRHNDANVLGIVGPMRMNYEHNLAIISYLDELIHHP